MESIFAAEERKSKRNRSIPKDDLRNEFVRDRDRILYSKEFRRLSGKTQVFVAGFDDHLRTRLTHTLEVAQISEIVCFNLQLNVSLARAISYGHDIGHTPFGHIGERTLNLLTNECDIVKKFHISIDETDHGFKHNWQSLRVACTLESKNNGLNLTDYTLWGILNHSSLNYKKCNHWNSGNCLMRGDSKTCKKSIDNPKNAPDYSLSFYKYYKDQFLFNDSWSFEGILVKWCDEVAQRHHDIEDGFYSNIISKDEVLENFKTCFKGLLTIVDTDRIDAIHRENSVENYIPMVSKLIVDFYVRQIISNGVEKLQAIQNECSLNSKEDFYAIKADYPVLKIGNFFAFSNDFEIADEKFHEFLRERILHSYVAQSMDGKANYIMRKLINAYLSNPQQLPDGTVQNLVARIKSNNLYEYKTDLIPIGECRQDLHKMHHETSTKDYQRILIRTIVDFIAGMTDDFAVEQYEKLYGGAKFRHHRYF